MKWRRFAPNAHKNHFRKCKIKMVHWNEERKWNGQTNKIVNWRIWNWIVVFCFDFFSSSPLSMLLLSFRFVSHWRLHCKQIHVNFSRNEIVEQLNLLNRLQHESAYVYLSNLKTEEEKNNKKSYSNAIHMLDGGSVRKMWSNVRAREREAEKHTWTCSSLVLFVVMICWVRDLCFSFGSARANAFMSRILLHISFHTVHHSVPETRYTYNIYSVPIYLCITGTVRVYVLPASKLLRAQLLRPSSSSLSSSSSFYSFITFS